MHVINHNWSAMKQRPYPQSVAEIRRHSVLSGDRIHHTVSLQYDDRCQNEFENCQQTAKENTTNARFYELGLTRDSRVILGLTVVSVLSTSNLGLNWD